MRLEIKKEELFLDDEFICCVSENTLSDFGGNRLFDFSETVNEKLPIELHSLKKNDFYENIYFYSNTEEVYFENNEVIVSLYFNYKLEYWDFGFSPNEFLNAFIKIKRNEKDTYDVQLYEHELTVIIVSKLDNDISLGEKINFLRAKYNYYLERLANKGNIYNTIFLKKQHVLAGVSILQYFSKILQEKYPNENISVSIKQDGLKVTMIIVTPDGKKEEIEEYLNRYGMVVMNQLPPEEFTSNPIQLLELKQELRDAQNKIAFQQELLVLKDDTYKNRILSLEDEVKFLREEFSALRKSNDGKVSELLSSLIKKDKLIIKLTKSIEKRDDKQTKQLLLELKEKDSQGYISLKQHLDSAIVGGIVNAPSWIQFMITHFPK